MDQKPQIEKQLGIGIDRQTFLARSSTGQPIVIKELSLGQLQNWKQYDLFEREAKVLQHLKHPRIAHFIGYQQEEREGVSYLQLLTQYIPGDSLQTKLDLGWRTTEAENRNMARQILEILCFLQRQSPAMIHRDLKPANLILTPQNELFLVDFGAVQESLRPRSSTTVVGTYGYMAPEQYLGQANLATDIYGLAATLVHLLSGVSPAEMRSIHMLPDFRSRVTASEAWCNMLEQWLQPESSQRPLNAQAALCQLDELESDISSSASGRLHSYPDSERRVLEVRPDPIWVWIWLAVLFFGVIHDVFWISQLFSPWSVCEWLNVKFNDLFWHLQSWFPETTLIVDGINELCGPYSQPIWNLSIAVFFFIVLPLQIFALFKWWKAAFKFSVKLGPEHMEVVAENGCTLHKPLKEVRITKHWDGQSRYYEQGQTKLGYSDLRRIEITLVDHQGKTWTLPERLNPKERSWLFAELEWQVKQLWKQDIPHIEQDKVIPRRRSS